MYYCINVVVPTDSLIIKLVTSFAVSVVTCCLITWLLYAEISYYLDAHFKFKFLPDTDFDAKLKINVDLTVAMPCHGKCRLDNLKEVVNQMNGLKCYLRK
jgi:hypothetical protein